MKLFLNRYVVVLCLPLFQACASDSGGAAPDLASSTLTEPSGELDSESATALKNEIIDHDLGVSRIFRALPHKISSKRAAEMQANLTEELSKTGCTFSILRGSRADNDLDGIPSDIKTLTTCSSTQLISEFEVSDINDNDWESGFRFAEKSSWNVPAIGGSKANSGSSFQSDEITKSSQGNYSIKRVTSDSKGNAMTVQVSLTSLLKNVTRDNESVPTYQEEGNVSSMNGFLKLPFGDKKSITLRIEAHDLRYNSYTSYGTYRFTDVKGRVFEAKREPLETWKFVFDGKDF